MAKSKSKRKLPIFPEWLFISTTVSVCFSAILWYLHGSLFGIISFIFIESVGLLYYYIKTMQEDKNV